MIMSLQNSLNNNTVPFIRHGLAISEADAILLQDAGRSVPLLAGTVMAKVAATQKWVPFTNETAIDGTGVPLGILMSDDVLAATLVAGDVTDVSILTGAGVLVDEGQVVIENAKTLATVILATTGIDNVFTQTVKDYLANVGIRMYGTVDVSSFENA